MASRKLRKYYPAASVRVTVVSVHSRYILLLGYGDWQDVPDRARMLP